MSRRMKLLTILVAIAALVSTAEPAAAATLGSQIAVDVRPSRGVPQVGVERGTHVIR